MKRAAQHLILMISFSIKFIVLPSRTRHMNTVSLVITWASGCRPVWATVDTRGMLGNDVVVCHRVWTVQHKPLAAVARCAAALSSVSSAPATQRNPLSRSAEWDGSDKLVDVFVCVCVFVCIRERELGGRGVGEPVWLCLCVNESKTGTRTQAQTVVCVCVCLCHCRSLCQASPSCHFGLMSVTLCLKNCDMPAQHHNWPVTVSHPQLIHHR